MKTTTLKEHRIEGQAVLRLISKVSTAKRWDPIERKAVAQPGVPAYYIQAKRSPRGWTHLSMTASEERIEELWSVALSWIEKLGAVKLGDLLPEANEY